MLKTKTIFGKVKNIQLWQAYLMTIFLRGWGF